VRCPWRAFVSCNGLLASARWTWLMWSPLPKEDQVMFQKLEHLYANVRLGENAARHRGGDIERGTDHQPRLMRYIRPGIGM
jgi:hypothetical protein